MQTSRGMCANGVYEGSVDAIYNIINMGFVTYGWNRLNFTEVIWEWENLDVISVSITLSGDGMLIVILIVGILLKVNKYEGEGNYPAFLPPIFVESLTWRDGGTKSV